MRSNCCALRCEFPVYFHLFKTSFDRQHSTFPSLTSSIPFRHGVFLQGPIGRHYCALEWPMPPHPTLHATPEGRRQLWNFYQWFSIRNIATSCTYSVIVPYITYFEEQTWCYKMCWTHMNTGVILDATERVKLHFWLMWVSGSPVGWGTAVHAGRSRVRFPIGSSRIFSDLMFPAALWP